MASEVKIDSKSSLLSTAQQLSSRVSGSGESAKSSITRVLSGVSDCDQIKLTSGARTISKDLNVLLSNLKNVSTTFMNYSNAIDSFDVDDFASVDVAELFSTASKSVPEASVSTKKITSITLNKGSSSSSGGAASVGAAVVGSAGSAIAYSVADTSTFSGTSSSGNGTGASEEQLNKVSGKTITLPSGLGTVRTYMGWQMITNTSSPQYKLRSAAGMKFDKEGFGKIGDRYVIACTTTFGNVGDYIDVYLANGTVQKCIIGDIKNQNDSGCNKWGHLNGDCVIEYVVDKSSWYSGGRGAHANPGTSSCHPEWHQAVTKIVNKGNYFSYNSKTDSSDKKKTNDDSKKESSN